MVKKNFTRKELIKKIYQKIGFSKNYSSTIIDDFFEHLVQSLIKSEKIKISSFGTFLVQNKKKEWVEILKQKLKLLFYLERLLNLVPLKYLKIN